MIVTINKNEYHLNNNNYLDAGKEATIYNLKNGSIIKVLEDDSKSENKIKKRLALCDKSDYLSRIKGFENIAVPVYPAYSSKAICGFSMPFFKDCKTISELGYDLFENAYSFKNVSDVDLFKIIEKLFDTLQILHHQKIILGDVNSNNILWNPKTNEVYIIDLDSAKVGDFFANMSTLGYLCPVVEKIGVDQDGGLSFSTSSDIYALTIICFELLMGVHPCDVGIKPAMDKFEKMEKGITYLNYHFLNKNNYKGYHFFDREEFSLIFKRLDVLKWSVPKIYNHFVNVFHFGKRKYLQQKNIIKKTPQKRTRKIQAIRSRSKNNRQYDPKEFTLLLNTYNLKLPNYVK